MRAFAAKARTTTDITMNFRMQNIAGFLLPDADRVGAEACVRAPYRPWSKEGFLPA